MTNESGELDTLKIVNIIFAEHEKLSIENPLLKDLIKQLEELNNLEVEKTRLYQEAYTKAQESVNLKDEENKKLRKKNSRNAKISVGCVIISFLIGFLL